MIKSPSKSFIQKLQPLIPTQKLPSPQSFAILRLFLRTFLHPLFSLTLLLPVTLSASSALTEKQILQMVTEEYGPVVPQSKLPALHAELEKMFQRLSTAQNELIGAQHLSLNQLRVIDSPVLNAFVVTQKSGGIRRIHNHVFITTGLLKKMFEGRGFGAAPDATLNAAPKAGDLTKGMARITGVLAHELAHPIEETDEESFKKNLGARTASQAREIRADAEGAMIAKKAGYPREAVYEGLSRLFEDARNTEGALSAAASTHPEHNLRLSTQRMLLTLNRYREGASPAPYPEAVRPSAFRDLQAVAEYEKEWAFARPKSIEEITKRLKALPGKEAYRNVEFTRLVLSLDKMLLEKGLADSERSAFREAAAVISGQSGVHLLSSRELRSFAGHDPGTKDLLLLPSHFDLMNRIPAYAEKDHLVALRAAFVKDGATLEDGKLTRVLRAAPAKSVVAEFKEELKQALTQNASSFSPRFTHDSFIRGKSREFEIRLTDLYHEEVAPALPEIDRLRMEVGHSYDNAYIIPSNKGYGPGDDVRQPGILRDRMQLLGDPRKKELQDMVKRHMQRFWEQRGRYGTLDVIAELGSYDWEAIWRVLGVDPAVGRQQLRASVKQFTKSKEYADLMETISNASGVDEFNGFRPGSGGISKFQSSIAWADESLYDHLAGSHNPHLKEKPELLELTRQKVAGVLLRLKRFEPLHGRVYARAFQRLAKAHDPLTAEKLLETHRAVIQEILGPEHLHNGSPVFSATFEKLPGTPEAKRVFLREVLIGAKGENLGWLTAASDAGAKSQTVALLLKHRAAESATDLLRLLLRSPLKTEDPEFHARYFGALGDLREPAWREWEAAIGKAEGGAEKRRLLLGFVEEFLDPAFGRYDDLSEIGGNSKNLRCLKSRLLSLSENLDLSRDEKLRLFQRLSATGPNQGTDIYFRKHLGHLLSETSSGEAHTKLKSLAKAGRFQSSSLQVDVARKLLGGEVDSLAVRGNATVAQAESLVQRLREFVPADSLKKDQFLEEIAWKLDLHGKPLLALIEDEKSVNWRKANPLLVNLGSAVGGPVANASAETRRHFLEFLLDPEGREMPEFLVKNIERTIYEEIMRAGKKEEGAARTMAAEGANAFKHKLEAALMDATPNERIPLFELILSSGKNGLLHDPSFPHNISRRYLKYSAGSVEEKLLEAFLAVIPPYERPVTLAYLLSQVGQDKSSVKSLFEVFQTVGIKFGQMTSIWKVFGDKVAKETASLKDSATPLAKAEIEEILDSLPHEERSLVKRLKKVVGSASLKTVVEVELKDGREAVLLVQRPFAEDQIRSNLDLSARFLQELRRREVDVPVGLFDAVVTDLRSQVLAETKMTDEAGKIRAAGAHFEQLNRDMAGRLNGYRFSVPAPVKEFQPRDNILLLEKAEGITWARAPGELRKATGALIVESSLRTLFREGWFDPDRHGGNVLIDPKTRTIYPIDFGQAETYSKHPFWRSDDRYVFMRFLQGISESDSGLITESGLRMVEKNARVDGSALKKRLETALAATRDKPVHDRIIAVTNAFVDSGGKFERRFSFGGLKGLMILHGEQYVSSEEFAAILRQEAAALTRRKLPLACADYFRRLLTSSR